MEIKVGDVTNIFEVARTLMGADVGSWGQFGPVRIERQRGDTIGSIIDRYYREVSGEEDEEKPILAGDVVRLKSGGPRMTVCVIEDGVANCAWFPDDTSESIGIANIEVEGLKKVV